MKIWQRDGYYIGLMWKKVNAFSPYDRASSSAPPGRLLFPENLAAILQIVASQGGRGLLELPGADNF